MRAWHPGVQRQPHAQRRAVWMRDMVSLPNTKVACPPCIVCGKQAQLIVRTEDLHRYEAGALVQHAFLEMPAADREMFISGTHPECWDTLYPEETS